MINTYTTDEIISRNRQFLEPIPTDMKPILQTLPDVKAVLFDIYGTLLISAAGDIQYDDIGESADVIRKSLQKAGVSTTMSSQDLKATYLHLLAKHQNVRRRQGIDYPEVDIRAVWRDFIKDLSGVEPSQEDAERIATWFEVLSNPTDLMPGAKVILKDLSESFRLGLISNAQFYTRHILELYLQETLEQMGISSSLTALSYEFLEGKPGMLMFSSCASYLLNQEGLQPDEVLYVGNDCLKDVYPAKSVGFRTALFAGDARSLRLREDDRRCHSLSPDLVITELSQLRDCLVGI
jgi:putative hydrolase of the HAD superfamily